jgi:hypothetical protein
VLSDSSSLEELAWGAAGAHPGFRGQLWGSMRSRVWVSASLTQTAPAPTASRPLSTVWGPPGGRAPLVGGRVDALQQPAAGQHPHPAGTGRHRPRADAGRPGRRWWLPGGWPGRSGPGWSCHADPERAGTEGRPGRGAAQPIAVALPVRGSSWSASLASP